MTNNRKIAHLILTALKKEGLEPYNVVFDNDSFYSFIPDSVVEFHIKGIKNWRFGMWIDYALPNFTVQFFTQYEPEIDKFKPSRSIFRVTVDRVHIERYIENRDWIELLDVIQMVKHIKYNAKLAYVQEHNWSLYVTEPVWKEYILHRKSHYKCEFQNFKKHILEELIPYNYNKISAKILTNQYDFIDHIEIVDCNTDGWVSFPRYEVCIYFNRVSDDTTEQTDLIDKWWNSISETKLFTETNTSFRYFTTDGIEW